MESTFLKYLTGSPATGDPTELDQLFQLTLERRGAILVAPLSTVTLALMIFSWTRSAWALVWIPYDIAITAWRYRVMIQADGRSIKQRKSACELLVALGIAWLIPVAIALYFSVISGITPLMLTAAIIATGVATTIASRNAATPRSAIIMIGLLIASLCLAFARSGFVGMLIPSLLTMAWAISLYLLLMQNHASAVRLIRAETYARRSAVTDELTGLYNRTYFAERRQALQANNLTYGFLCIDLDGFKTVNDDHGHACGDELLRVMAERMRANVRENDTVFRTGGDEFIMLLPQANRLMCESAARRLLASLSEPVELSSKGHVQVGASIGSACSIDGTSTVEDVLRTADAALYRAKASGKGIHIHWDLQRLTDSHLNA